MEHELAWTEGFRDFICEVDALLVIQILNQPPTIRDPMVWLIEDCRLLIAHD